MRAVILALCLLATPAAALDVEWNSPSDQTSATMVLAAKALGIWDDVHSQLLTGQVDAQGNLWAIYVEGKRYNCTTTCTPKGDGFWVHMRYLGPLSGPGTPPALTANIAVGGTPTAPTFTWIGASPAPGSVTITIDDRSHARWM